MQDVHVGRSLNTRLRGPTSQYTPSRDQCTHVMIPKTSSTGLRSVRLMPIRWKSDAYQASQCRTYITAFRYLGSVACPGDPQTRPNTFPNWRIGCLSRDSSSDFPLPSTGWSESSAV